MRTHVYVATHENDDGPHVITVALTEERAKADAAHHAGMAELRWENSPDGTHRNVLWGYTIGRHELRL